MSASDVLVVAEIHRRAVAGITCELLTAARGLTAATGGQVICVVLSDDGARYVPSLSAADRIIQVDDPQLADFAPEPFVTALAQVVAAQQPRAVLVPGSSIGWDLAPLLAGRLQAPLVTACKSVEVAGSALAVKASFYAGKMTADLSIDASPAVLMIMPGSFRAATEAGAGQVESHAPAAPLAPGAVRFQDWVLPEAGDVDITQQDILVAVGRGIQQQDNVALAEELAQALGGAVCASRPVVDQGWLPATRQVGKSGMTVRPKLYLALGVSGAPEHLEGMDGAELVIAVNTDPTAPIFGAAHYGAEADALDLLPALVEAISAQRA